MVKVQHLELAAVGDGDLLGGGTRLGADLLHGLDDVEALDGLAEHGVLAIEPRGLGSADEELRAVGCRREWRSIN